MAHQKAYATTISFAPIDSGNRPARKSGLIFSGESWIWNGSTFVNTTSNPAEVGSTGRYTLALTAAEMNLDNVHIFIEKTGIDPEDIILVTSGHKTASVVADGGNTAATFKTSFTSAVNDHYKDALVQFTSGALIDEVKKITAYDGTTKFITVQGGFTAAPSASDLFKLLNF